MSCVSVRPWRHRHTYLGSFFFDPEDVRELSLGAIWNFIKRTGLMTWTLAKGHKGPVKGLRATGLQGPDPLFTHTLCRMRSAP
jgi:hypothetical protein